MVEDPVYTRWKRQHPTFPGVAMCVELLGRRNVRGSLVDIICAELQENATTHAAELIAAFGAEQNERLRRLLLGIISAARLVEALPLLVEQLRSEDERIRFWSEQGLLSLNTPSLAALFGRLAEPGPEPEAVQETRNDSVIVSQARRSRDMMVHG